MEVNQDNVNTCSMSFKLYFLFQLVQSNLHALQIFRHADGSDLGYLAKGHFNMLKVGIKPLTLSNWCFSFPIMYFSFPHTRV